jgi:hypothetical protein
MSTIITRNSANSGSQPSSLVQGELAINVTDNRLFFGSGSGNTVKEFGVTASYALNALTASYAISASYEINYETSSSYADFAVSASHALNANNAISSSYALTASYVQNAQTASYVLNAVSASFASTASYVLNAISASYYDEKDPVFVAKSASLATTGSNIFKGDQTVTGSLFTSGSNTLIGSTTLTGSLNITGSTIQTGNNTLIGNTTLSGSIIISGSTTAQPTVQVYGNVTHDGYIRFNPVSTNIDTSISASYIYVSGSTNDLYFSQNGSGYNNVTRLRWLEGNLYTGLLHGGLITTASSTVYRISSGSGIIVDLNASLTTDPYPIVQFLQWGNLSASIAPLTASYQQAFVGIDSTGNIFAQGTPFSNGQFDALINIGGVFFQNQSTINGVKTQPSVAYGFEQQQNIFNRAFGPLKLSGYTLAPSGSSTGSLIVGSGTAYAPGSNYAIDPNEPSYTVDNGTTISKIFRYRQSGSTWVYDTNAGAGYTTIDPGQYSNNGVLTTVQPNDWSIQRVFWFPNSVIKAIVVYYGNQSYSTEADAIANISIESFVEAPNTSANAIYLGAIIIRGNGVLTTPADFTIVPGGLFRQVGGSGGGGSIITQTLAGLSDVSISGPTNGQPLVYNNTSGKWQNLSTLTANLIGNADTATSASYATTASYVLQAVSASFATLAQTANTASYVVTAQTASYVLNAVSASYATNALSSSFTSTASYVNTLNQNVLITGTAAIGTSSLGPNENTLTLGARDAANEGGQLGLNAPGGTYTSSSFVDVWQNFVRILRGSNAGSDGLVTQWNLHTKQMQLPAYTAASSFPGTATANLAVDSGGNIITVSTTGGSVFPYVGNAVITGSLTTTGIIYAQPNGGMYFQGGDDAALYDINVANTMGVYGMQTVTEGAIKLGSNGPVLYGSGSRLGIGTTTPTSASLTVNGNVWATSFTGSLLGTSTTASYVLNAVSASFATLAQTANTASYVVTAQTASYVLQAVSASFATTASYSNTSTSASYALSASYAPSTPAFPFNGNAQISGSLGVTGSFTTQTFDGLNYVNAISIGNFSRAIYDVMGTSSFDADGRILFDDMGIFAVNWSGRTLYDATGTANSIAWGSRLLYDQTSVQSIDWNTRIAYDGTGTTYAIDWGNRSALDGFGISSIGWNGRALEDSTGVTALSWDTITNNYKIEASTYLKKSITPGTQESFSNVPTTAFNYEGEVIGGQLDGTVALFDLVYLETDGKWYPVTQATADCTKLLGICAKTGVKPEIILEGTITVNDGTYATTPVVQSPDHGLPIYVRESGGNTMSTNVPTTAGQYVRILGHAYYQNIGAPEYWVMKFRPSNDWYVI